MTRKPHQNKWKQKGLLTANEYLLGQIFKIWQVFKSVPFLLSALPSSSIPIPFTLLLGGSKTLVWGFLVDILVFGSTLILQREAGFCMQRKSLRALVSHCLPVSVPAWLLAGYSPATSQSSGRCCHYLHLD